MTQNKNEKKLGWNIETKIENGFGHTKPRKLGDAVLLARASFCPCFHLSWLFFIA
jgi:hypothetical protein